MKKPRMLKDWVREFEALLRTHGPQAKCLLQRLVRKKDEAPYWEQLGAGPLAEILDRFRAATAEKRGAPTRVVLVRGSGKEPLFLLTHPPVDVARGFDRAPSEDDEVVVPEKKSASLGL